MTENKSSALTDAEIIKALKLCGCTPDCSWCPYYDKEKQYKEKCYIRRNRDFTDLINRLRSEKEALIAGQETLQKALAEKIAEVEKLTYCKYCEHYELMTSNNQHFCNKYGGYVNENDYCSRCERSESE